MDGLTKLELQEQITAQVKKIVETINEVVPEDWTKAQMASVFQLFIEVYR